MPLAEWGDNAGFGTHFWLNVSYGGVGGAGSLYAAARSGDASFFASPPGIIRPNLWQHIAFTYDKASGWERLFHNGVEVAAKHIGPVTAHTSFNLNLGRRLGGDTYQGQLDEFSLYSRALNSNELAALYQVGVTGKCLPAAWQVDPPSGTPLMVHWGQDFSPEAPVNYTLAQITGSPPAGVQSGDAGSSGRFLRLVMDGFNSQANAICFDRAAPGAFRSVQAEFDFRLTSADSPADGFAFLLIPTAIYGTNGPGFVTPIPFEEPNIPGVLAVGFDVFPHGSPDSVNDVSVHWDGAELVNERLGPGLDLASGNFHHCKIVLTHVPGGAIVAVTLTPNINALPGAPVRPILTFVPGLNPYESRVEFAGRTGALDVSVDLDNVSLLFTTQALNY
ncbi:MAG TPA: LamG domain-containing protein [Methylomirabilota bacterium]|nr:LamG domain-containing protein [Methylomirabilota bacterium]